jgi:hypothetical protein
MRTIAIQDKTFSELPEIRPYQPCAVEIKTVKVTETGEQFNIAKVTAIIKNKPAYFALYPKGNSFAKQTCKVIFKTFLR